MERTDTRKVETLIFMNYMRKTRTFVLLVVSVSLVVPSFIFARTCNSKALVPVQYGDRSSAVANMQACLGEAGYPVSDESGYYGSSTMKASKDFYAAWHGTWDGLRIGQMGVEQLKKAKAGTPVVAAVSKARGIARFTSARDFREYIGRSQGNGYSLYGLFAKQTRMVEMALPAPTDIGMAAPAGLSARSDGGSVSVDRYSETNVQVAGIDEPDIVKTNGKDIYFSPGYVRRWWGVMEGPVRPMAVQSTGAESKIMPTPRNYPEISDTTRIINALPVSDLKVKGNVDMSGDLLLDGTTLMGVSSQEINGFDVSNASSVQKLWTVKLESNTSLSAVRLYKNKLYLVAKTYVQQSSPCPLKPLSSRGVSVIIPCTEIYHPIRPVSTDSTFTAMVIDTKTGAVEKRVSFVGSANNSAVYMSEKALYVTYTYSGNVAEFLFNFMNAKGQDIFPADVRSKMATLKGYSLSDAARIIEYQSIINNYYASLDEDARLKVQNEAANRMSDYYKEHLRELETTGIAKIDLGTLSVTATGNVPGHPLNQFSLDEYNGSLRVATTIGENWTFNGIVGGSRSDTVNDVYVLNSGMNVTGSVRDLGKGERIYSVRFVGDKGYVVTFRQTDPFYVLNLSNPQSPVLSGELKIPGYSSYLDPLTDTLVVGIGKEGSQVKVSLFDVSSPSNPKEASKYLLDEYWSDLLNTHHAFMKDTKHQVFFMPGSKGGYVFSYAGNELKLAVALSDSNIRRALYVNDYLYILGNDKLAVYNEADWSKAGELNL